MVVSTDLPFVSEMAFIDNHKLFPPSQSLSFFSSSFSPLPQHRHFAAFWPSLTVFLNSQQCHLSSCRFVSIVDLVQTLKIHKMKMLLPYAHNTSVITLGAFFTMTVGMTVFQGTGQQCQTYRQYRCACPRLDKVLC